MLSSIAENKRQLIRLSRQPDHMWQLKIDGDLLVTKNITNISPTGLAFKAPLAAHFRKGQVLKMNLTLEKDENFDCEGEIVWTLDAVEDSGSMRQLGVRFSNLPARFDATIMQEINRFVLRERRLALDNGKIPEFIKAHSKKKQTLRYIVVTTCGTIVLLATLAALITAVYIHHVAHPEDSFEYKFNRAMIKKMVMEK